MRPFIVALSLFAGRKITNIGVADLRFLPSRLVVASKEFGRGSVPVGIVAAAMADRSVHYEAAFEGYLREKGIPYVSVDEAKKALFQNSRLKSFDFVVYSRAGPNLLVDIKGRQCSTNSKRRSFQTWATQDDIDDLAQWEQVFGDGFHAVLSFVYWIDPPIAPEPGMFLFRDRWYWMFGVDVSEYRQRMRARSPKWKTVCLSAADFRELAKPIEGWL